jgi:hypothetical protein
MIQQIRPHVRVERNSGMCVARDLYELWGRSPYTRMFVAWVPRLSTCEKHRAAPRASALAHQDNSALQTGKKCSFPLHTSRVALFLLRQRRGRGNDLGATMKSLKKITSGAAGIGLGTTIKYPRRTTGALVGVRVPSKTPITRSSSWLFSDRCQNREEHSSLAIHTAAFVHALVLLAAGLALCYGESINLT